MIRTATELDFSAKKFTMIIAGAPGLGKTTLALSAPKPLLFDLDNGISRVKASHRKLTSVVGSYEEMLTDMESQEYRECETVIIDTGGSLVQVMQPWAKKNNVKAARDGRAMFGEIKKEFLSLIHRIQSEDKKNLIIIFHTTEQVNGDSVQIRLSCEGSVKDVVWTSADFGGQMSIFGKTRRISFSPTHEYHAKGCFGVSGTYDIPELGDGKPNTFLTDLFQKVNEHLIKETEDDAESRAKYDAVMEEVNEIIDEIVDANTANEAVKRLSELKHVTTTKSEMGNIFKAKVKELGLAYDKATKTYV